MKQKRITFYGESRDHNGLPYPFHSYLIIENEAPWLGSDKHYISSIVPLDDSAPLPKEKHFVSSHGLHSALSLAVDALKNQAQLIHLKSHIA